MICRRLPVAVTRSARASEIWTAWISAQLRRAPRWPSLHSRALESTCSSVAGRRTFARPRRRSATRMVFPAYYASGDKRRFIGILDSGHLVGGFLSTTAEVSKESLLAELTAEHR